MSDMTRTHFIKMFLGGAVIASVGLSIEKHKGKIGHCHAGDPGTENIEAVYVDGVKIPDVFELDDHEGYVRHFIKVPYGEGVPTVEIKTGHWQERYDLRQCMTHGRVIVKWRNA